MGGLDAGLARGRVTLAKQRSTACANRASSGPLRKGRGAVGRELEPPARGGEGPYVERALAGDLSPVVAVTDHVKLVPDQIVRFVHAPFCSLGTDGFGFSDTRAALRRHFETDVAHVVVAVLSSLVREGIVAASTVVDAERHYGIERDAPDPRDA